MKTLLSVLNFTIAATMISCSAVSNSKQFPGRKPGNEAIYREDGQLSITLPEAPVERDSGKHRGR